MAAAHGSHGAGPVRQGVRARAAAARREARDAVLHMKTTLNLADSAMQRLREESARRGVTVSALVEAGLRRVLAEPGPSRRSGKTAAATAALANGGHRVDIANREAPRRLLDEE